LAPLQNIKKEGQSSQPRPKIDLNRPRPKVGVSRPRLKVNQIFPN